MTRLGASLLTLFAASLVACAVEPNSPGGSPEVLGGGRPTFDIAATACGTYASSTENGLLKFWNCGTTINLSTGTGPDSITAALTGATNFWNGILGGRNLFSFTVNQSASRTVTVVHQADAPGYTGWCGATDYDGNAVASQIRLWRGTACNFSSPQPLGDVVRHELGHAVGFSNDWHSPGTDSVAGHCSLAIHGGLLQQGYCQYEQELVYALYGVRSTPAQAAHYVTTVNISRPTLSVLETPATAQITGLTFAHANAALCPSQYPNPAPGLSVTCEALPTDGGTATWVSSNPNVISVQSTGPTSALLTRHTGAEADVVVRYTPVLYARSTRLSETGTTLHFAAMPDLAPGTFAAPSNASLGGSFAVSLPETNLSTTQVPAGWVGRLYLSTDATLSSGDSLVGTFTESSVIAPSTTITTSRTAAVPSSLAAGNYFVLAVLDATTVVPEADETNNVRASTATVVVAPSPPSAFSTSAAGCQLKGSIIRYLLTWHRGSGTTYEIRHGTVDDVAQGTLMSSGAATTTSVSTPYYSTTTPPLVHYWWLRELAANGTPGPWVANVINGQSAADGCIF
jgi:hypothetical protein